MTPPLPGAVVYAQDLPRLGRFYVAVAGLAIIHEEAGNFHTSDSRRTMQRSRPFLIPDCSICAVLHEEPCKFHTSRPRRIMQRGRALLVLDCRVCTVLQEEACKFHTSRL